LRGYGFPREKKEQVTSRSEIRRRDARHFAERMARRDHAKRSGSRAGADRLRTD
jgi:hypothetical protein